MSSKPGSDNQELTPLKTCRLNRPFVDRQQRWQSAFRPREMVTY
ncbi:hypothetical protein BN2476_370002 [Paraburkholderia piptadeniae]|uniref:Uncharacterized protein n=1 Tax=Paraburkholderia piptadeniae TaxID=1701573 RepID=A0A1N7S9F8_9BURK|nr:hypothetical protein BN2476_370002 [Paraburkholderia piptadeniae]